MGNEFQTELVAAVAPCHNNEKGVCISGYLCQPIFKRIADDFCGSGLAGMFCELGAVLQDSDRTADHQAQLDDGYGNMAAAADDNSFLPAKQFIKYGISFNDSKALLGIACSCRTVGSKKSMGCGFPYEAGIRKKGLFPCRIPFDDGCDGVAAVWIEFFYFLI